MELQQLRYVVAVAEERNFTRAAQRCFVVQSSLSHQIKALERELGFALFARSSRRVELTAAGEAFTVQARASLDAAERAVSDAAAATGIVRGRLTVGVIPTVTAIDVPAALGVFHRAYPDVQIALRTGASDEFLAAIAAGEMDVAVLGLPDEAAHPAVATRVLLREELVAVVAADHPLASRAAVSLTDLAEERFTDFPAGGPGRQQSDRAFEAAGIAREVAFEVMSPELMLALVRQGLVVALLSPQLIPSGEGVIGVPVADGPRRVVQVAWSRFNPSPAARAFLADVLG